MSPFFSPEYNEPSKYGNWLCKVFFFFFFFLALKSNFLLFYIHAVLLVGRLNIVMNSR